jgi:hypothetical protein
MEIHGAITLRCLTIADPAPITWVILFLLFVVFITLLASGLTLGLLR